MGKSITKNEKPKKTKQVMVRLPQGTIEVIDGFVGATHSSRPDFIIDATRQFLNQVLRAEHETIENLKSAEEEGDLSTEAKEGYYYKQMTGKITLEMINLDRFQDEYSYGADVNVLLSIPVGLLDLVTETAKRISKEYNHQDFIKLAIRYMIDDMHNVHDLIIEAKEYVSTFGDPGSVEEEIRRLEMRFNGGVDFE